ncbi:MAG: hypothetical protein JKY48_03090 [Flavobacteriales bacterium]|nr:hypothetical protein [Flavobacteriales bacterium]
MKKSILFKFCCLLLVLSLSNSVEAQLDSITYRKKLILSAGVAVNQLQYYNHPFSEFATELGFTVDVGFHYRASPKTDLAFNFSRTTIAVDETDSQFDKITFHKIDPIKVDLILAGFKTFVGEKVTFFFMPQFGFVIMNYGVLDAVDEQQVSVYGTLASSHTRMAMTVAVGSDIKLKERIVVSAMAQYLISSKVEDGPIYQSFNASIGVGYQFK